MSELSAVHASWAGPHSRLTSEDSNVLFIWFSTLGHWFLQIPDLLGLGYASHSQMGKKLPFLTFHSHDNLPERNGSEREGLLSAQHFKRLASLLWAYGKAKHYGKRPCEAKGLLHDGQDAERNKWKGCTLQTHILNDLLPSTRFSLHSPRPHLELFYLSFSVVSVYRHYMKVFSPLIIDVCTGWEWGMSFYSSIWG